MNSLAELILYIYLIVFSSMLIFDIVTIFYQKANEERIKKIENSIDEHLKTIKLEELDEVYKKRLLKKLKSIGYFIAFTRSIEKMDSHKREKYLLKIKNIFSQLCKHYQKEEIIRQTFFIHFLHNYPYLYEKNTNTLITYFIQSTTSDSVYLRENALNALYKLGNPEYIKEALYQMNYLNVSHHHKLITDGLMRCTKNEVELVEMLINEFKNYNEEYKVAIINYFSYKKVDCKEAIYKILTTNIEPKEVKIACIRYFFHCKYDKAVPLLYDLVKDDKNNWEYSAIAASTLKEYPSKKTTEILIEALLSHNWYVRNNAASSLMQILDKSELQKLINETNDNYAKDALLYQLHLSGGK